MKPGRKCEVLKGHGRAKNTRPLSGETLSLTVTEHGGLMTFPFSAVSPTVCCSYKQPHLPQKLGIYHFHLPEALMMFFFFFGIYQNAQWILQKQPLLTETHKTKSCLNALVKRIIISK